LRRDTIEAFALAGAESHGYLLSSHRITPAALEDAAVVRGLGLPLLADNGTKELIDEVTDPFEDDAVSIRQEVRALRARVGRIPRGRDVPDALRQRAFDLADTVVSAAAARSRARDRGELLAAQLSMDPTDIVANEDFGTACLMTLGLERETTGWSVGRFLTRNKRSLRLWRRAPENPSSAS
jgi:hypothetical protein